MPLRILLIDTETNGLPKTKFAPVSDFALYPAILQLSWAVYTIADVEPFWLHPGPKRDVGLTLDPSIPWDAGAAAVHGLSEIEARHGNPQGTRDALLELGRVLRTVNVIVAHNLAFDKPVLRAAALAEASRLPAESDDAIALRNLWPPVAELKEFCTMSQTRNLVQIPATTAQSAYTTLGAYKSPKLNELYAWIYGHAYDISGAFLHTAKSDVDCLALCIVGLLKQGHLRPRAGSLICAAD